MPLATIPLTLADRAALHGDRAALRFEGATWTYAALTDDVRAAAGALHAWGLRRGDRVALYLDNTPSFPIAYLAVLWCGAIVVPVNSRYRETELRHMLRDAEPRIVITDAQGAATTANVRADAPAVETVVVLGGDRAADPGRWEALARSAPLPDPLSTSGDDLALIAYTSGTTGRSKGAMLSHANLLANARAVGGAWRWTDNDHLLLTLPLFHIHGLGVGFHGTLVHGASLTLHRRFDAEEVLRDLASGTPTLFFGVPTMYARLLAAAGERPVAPGLRLLVSGSAPLAAATHEQVERAFGHRILERYGMTETIMLAGNPLAGPRRAGSVGVPFDGVELRVADPSSARLATTGVAGEVQVRGPGVTRGYWRDPASTLASFTDDGWFKTGDLGVLDADGYLTLTGRAHELIISGGFNVYPREVEEVIATLNGV
ncbi:MAG: AMP-binding protein, partial [bacterium]|nr:AMP-binding protein [bacterium]